MWARQSYRFGPLDFEANAKEGVGVPWPVTYDEIAPWYDKAEIFAGISGSVEGLYQLPDGKYLPPHDLNCVEVDFKKRLDEKLGRKLIIGRCANLTAPLTHNESPQRGTCQARNMCIRGCPFGGYFSSVSATLPSAERTGNMTLLADQIVYELIYDNDKGKATGVRVLDAETGKQTDYFAKIVFLCASALGSAYIMLNSTSSRFPNGFGNDSGELGHNIMDHNKPGSSNAQRRGLSRRGLHRPPAERLLHPALSQRRQGQARLSTRLRLPGPRRARGLRPLQRQRARSARSSRRHSQEPGPWNIGMTAFGEILPNHDNHARLDRDKKDKHGLPLLVVNAVVRENERKMEEDMKNDAAEMLEAAGFKNVKVKQRLLQRRQQHPRERHGAHGRRSEEVGAQQVQPGPRLQERVRHRRFVHAVVRLPESFAHLHGVHGARGRPRGRRTQEGQPMTRRLTKHPEMLQRRELLQARGVDVGRRRLRARGARDPAGLLGERGGAAARARAARSSSTAAQHRHRGRDRRDHDSEDRRPAARRMPACRPSSTRCWPTCIRRMRRSASPPGSTSSTADGQRRTSRSSSRTPRERAAFVKQSLEAALAGERNPKPFILMARELTLLGFFTSQSGHHGKYGVRCGPDGVPRLRAAVADEEARLLGIDAAGGAAMTVDRRIIDLYNEYVHTALPRREFLTRLASHRRRHGRRHGGAAVHRA